MPNWNTPLFAVCSSSTPRPPSSPGVTQHSGTGGLAIVSSDDRRGAAGEQAALSQETP